MTGPTNFHWTPLERLLDDVASRGCQTVFRFYLEYPGKPTGVPAHLVAAGVELRRWTNTNTHPLPSVIDHTPDYEDPRLRAALTNFIAALGARYDGDPRIGFITAGLLGTERYRRTRWLAHLRQRPGRRRRWSLRLPRRRDRRSRLQCAARREREVHAAVQQLRRRPRQRHRR